MQQNPNQTQVLIDENTDFLIQNLNQNNYKTLQNNKSEYGATRPTRGAGGLSALNDFVEKSRIDIHPQEQRSSGNFQFEKALMDQEIDEQEDFKLLFKYMNAWKKFHRA